MSFAGLSKKMFGCGQCGRSYTHKKSLKLHLRYECGIDPQFQCHFCVYRAKRKGELRRHLTRQHTQRVTTAKDAFSSVQGTVL